MKRILMIGLTLVFAAAVACNGETVVTEPPAATETAEVTSSVPIEAEQSDDTDIVTIPKTEWVVTEEEGMPGIETLSTMHSLRLLDLRAFSYTPYTDIEAIRAALPDCRILWNQKFTDGIFPSDSTELTLPHATEEDVKPLEAFSMLHILDASGSTAYEELYAFKKSHPTVEVHYSLPLGDMIVSENDTSIIVPNGTDAKELIAALRYFPEITDTDLRNSGWTEEDVTAFAEAFPQMHVHRMIRIGTTAFDSDEGLLDLRNETNLNEKELIEALSGFASLKTVALPKTMSSDDVDAIHTAYPDVEIVGPVTAFGKTIEGGAEEIDLSDTKIHSIEEIDALLTRLPFLKKAVLCDCGLSNEQMETLCNAYPDVKFVWMIEIGKRKLRTDAIGFSTKNPSKYTNPKSSDAYNESVKKAIRLKEGEIEALKYCTDLEALDLGHNYLANSDLEVIAGLTKLKILILADNKITDISVLTALKDLEYIELFMNKIPDLSPLTEMPSLIDVNVCNTGVSDLTPLFELTGVKRLWYAMNPASREQSAALKAALADCVCNYTARDETAEGWREDPRYQWMRSYFE